MCSVYCGVSLHYICIPFTMVRVLFFNCSKKWLGKVGHNHWMTSDIGASTISIVLCISVTFSDDQIVGDWMTGHMTSFFSTQFNASSIEMFTEAYMSSSYMIQCSYSHFSISALASSPTLGTKLCHILVLYT